MRFTTLSTLTLAAALALSACDDLNTAPSAVTEPEFAKGGGGKGHGKAPDFLVAYTHKEANGFLDIYTVTKEGTKEGVRLTNGNGLYSSWNPRWTVDQTRIIFSSNRAGAENIFIMNADGSNVEQLTVGGCADRNPAPSPDGTKIAFQRACAGGGIFVMNTDGTNVKQLTFTSSDMYPAWGSNGFFIYFTGFRTYAYGEIWRMNADGAGQGQYAPCYNGVACLAPAPVQDGTGRVAYWSSIGGGSIRIIDPNHNVTNVITNIGTSGTSYAPAWYVDGTKLIFSATVGGEIDLYSIDSKTGQNLVKLTAAAGADTGPSLQWW